ncbi:hypothetical protein [Streptosporangium sp. NPDC002721]|uniref:hypothetical protein n=1 Tax=Streptosporangium sp. NPDC002721 TaxID=3366188 RepID=UPI003696E622
MEMRKARSLRRKQSESPPPADPGDTSEREPGRDVDQSADSGGGNTEDRGDRGNEEDLGPRRQDDPPANDREEPEEFRRTRRRSVGEVGRPSTPVVRPPVVKLGWRPAQGRMTYWVRDGSGAVGARKESLIGMPRVLYTPVPDRQTRADGQLLVYAEPEHRTDPPIFVRRADLVDDGYEKTVAAIETLVRQSQDRLQQTFWPEKRRELDAMTEITLAQPVSGLKVSAFESGRVTADSLVTVPAGTHPLPEIHSSTLGFPDQLAPFSAIVEVNVEGGRQAVLIPGEIVWGSDRSHADTAQEQGVAQRITAERVMEVLIGDEYFARHLAGRRLTGDRLHYVTSQEMGAVFVLDGMPDGEEQIEIARTANEILFNAGLSTPGLSVNGHIFIQLDQLGTGTEYHEAIHWFSDPTVDRVLGHWFNEGLTEYLTRYPVSALGEEAVRSEDQYGPQRQAIEKLVRHAGIDDEQLCEAYFRGDIQPLYDAVAAAAATAGGTFSLDAFATCLDPARAIEALRHFDEVFGVADEAREHKTDVDADADPKAEAEAE